MVNPLGFFLAKFGEETARSQREAPAVKKNFSPLIKY
jgi:hypothetical protein